MTSAIDRRLEEHRFGLNKECYTFNRRPLNLIYHQGFMQFAQAELYETKIKKWSRKKKLALSNENYEMLKELSICKNKSNSNNYNP
jgi:putative endonuclease